MIDGSDKDTSTEKILDAVPSWITRMIQRDRDEVNLPYLMMLPSIHHILDTYNVSLQTIIDMVLGKNNVIQLPVTIVDTSEDDAAYIARCDAALASFSDRDKALLAQFPISWEEDPEVIRVCSEFNIEYEDLSDVAFTWYCEHEKEDTK